MRSFLLSTSIVLLFMPCLFAQVQAVPQAPADGGSTDVLQSIYLPPMPDAPFSLTLATEWVRPLGTDGNTVTVVNERKIARDRAGRIYQERVLLRPANVTGPWITNLIQISDTATHTYMNCFVFTKVCHVLPDNTPITPPDLQSGTTKYQGATQQRTSLGRDILLGQDVAGMHVTTVIDAGLMGNAKPITVDREFWYSPALGINLRSVRNDPRSGRQTFVVKKLSLDEPDPALWQVPAGFTVADDQPKQ